ncbi:MAG TPA: STAS domain-containing protein, partial [Armatimonadota bacterium]|nr:STAS domain-containing protein [Armatimonadota bacterium]
PSATSVLDGFGEGKLAFMSVRESLDLESSPLFLERVRPVLRNCRCLVVDLSGVEFVDSTGVRTLLSLADEMERQGRELRLVVRPGSRVERTLGLLKLLERFRTCGTLDEACRYSCPVS